MLDSLNEAAEKLLLASDNTLRWATCLIVLVGLLVMCEVPLYGYLQWILGHYRRGSIEKDWWKCLVYDADPLEHYFESHAAFQLVGALAASLFQSCLLALISVVLVQRSTVRIDWASSAVVNSAFTIMSLILPPFMPSFLVPSNIPSSLVSLASYVKPDMFDNLPKPNQCRKAYRFLTVVLGVQFSALFCNFASLLLAFRLAFRRRVVVVTAQKSSRSLRIEDDDSEEQKSVCRENEGDEDRVVPFTVGRIGIVTGCAALATYVVDVSASAKVGLVGQGSANRLVPSIADKYFHHASLNIFLKGYALYISRTPTFTVTGLAFFAVSMFLRGIATDDLAPIRVAGLVCAILAVYELPAWISCVHTFAQHNLYVADIVEPCKKYMIEGPGLQVFLFPSESDALHTCRLLQVHLYAGTVHIASLLVLAAICVLCFKFSVGTTATDIVAPQNSFGREQHQLPSTLGNEPRHFCRTLTRRDSTGFEFDVRHYPNRPRRHTVVTFPSHLPVFARGLSARSVQGNDEGGGSRAYHRLAS